MSKPKFRWARFGLVLLLAALAIPTIRPEWTVYPLVWAFVAALGSALFVNGDWGA